MSELAGAAQNAEMYRILGPDRQFFVGIYATATKCSTAVHMSRSDTDRPMLVHLDEIKTDGGLPAKIREEVIPKFAKSGRVYADCTENPGVCSDLEDILGSNLLVRSRFSNRKGNRSRLIHNITSAMRLGYGMPDHTAIKNAEMRKLTKKLFEEMIQETEQGADQAHLRRNTLILASALSLKAALECPKIPPLPQSAEVSQDIARSTNHIVAGIVSCLPTTTEPASIQHIQTQTMQALISIKDAPGATEPDDAVPRAVLQITGSFARHLQPADRVSFLRIQDNTRHHLLELAKKPHRQSGGRRRAADPDTTEGRNNAAPVRAHNSTGS